MNSNVLIKTIFEKSIVKDAKLIGIIVGTILNIVNQVDAFVNFNYENISISKLILTYFVPYFVSTYSSVKTKLSFNLVEECKKIHNSS